MKTIEKILLAPSLLSADFSDLSSEIKSVERAGADWIHVDVMDGHFVPNLTVGPVVLHWIRRATSLPLDVHLMISDPGTYIPNFAQAGADSITFHYEAVSRPGEIIRKIKRLGKKAGISIKPRTPVSRILPYLPQLDLVLVMTVEPGFGGQKFMPDMIPKMRVLKEVIAGKALECVLEVDGGINRETAQISVKEGARALVAGNSIFGEKDPGRALRDLRKTIDRII